MESSRLTADIYFKKTRLAYTWTRILNTPFWALYSLLPFILCKDIQATPFQIACLISLKPIVSLFSLYWSSQIRKRRDRLISNIIWAGILSHLPFLFVPWIHHPIFFIFASACYMLFYRGAHPAWMELLKINVPEETRKHVFAYGSAFYHVGGALLAIAIGWVLDDYERGWRWLFPFTALLSMGAFIFQYSIPIQNVNAVQDNVEKTFSFREKVQKPWQEAWELIKSRPDFTRFQLAFMMLGGGGLMLWQPALPQFFFETLQLNYKELTVAMVLCKSLGYTLTLPIWTRVMNQKDIFVFSGWVTAIAALFPLGLLAAQSNILWLYGAYFLYGLMQAGSELSWNLSGPIFSQQEDSSTYTGVNLISIGLRGCIAPPLGSVLCNFTNATVVLLMGGGFCLLATWKLYSYRTQESEASLTSSSA